ncbi:MAG TPA: FtsW/RodA/SpoVE family cell cycle protein, partial [Gemmatimonadales bacterium]|nr:FtsW/RodA/SpoVE family cell cycle protein [Gemmatimonadales bacterium]
MAGRRGLDRPLLAVTTALLVAGLATLYSAGQTDVPTAAAHLWERQLIFVAIGVIFAAVTFRISPRLLEWATPFIYGAGLLLLAITLVIGTGAGTAASTKSWIAIGGVRLGQPTELAKIATVLMLA